MNKTPAGRKVGPLVPFREMWAYLQMWFPLLTVALTAAICLSTVSFIMGQSKPQR